MRRLLSLVSVMVALSLIVSCAKKKAEDDEEITPVNNNPTLSTINVTPSFGVVGLTNVAGTATATDPDNDTLTFVWDVSTGNNSIPGGSPLVIINGPNFNRAMEGSGLQTARVTVSDGKGGTATDVRNFTVGNMTGTWAFILLPGPTATGCNALFGSGPFFGTFTQVGGSFSGPLSFQNGFCAAVPGTAGNTDPGAVPSISATGAVVIRFKAGAFPDFRFEGQMDNTGRVLTGGFFGSGFVGEAATGTKQ